MAILMPRVKSEEAGKIPVSFYFQMVNGEIKKANFL